MLLSLTKLLKFNPNIMLLLLLESFVKRRSENRSFFLSERGLVLFLAEGAITPLGTAPDLVVILGCCAVNSMFVAVSDSLTDFNMFLVLITPRLLNWLVLSPSIPWICTLPVTTDFAGCIFPSRILCLC